MKTQSLRDYFWIWGHDAGCHHASATNKSNIYKLSGTNKMDLWEGAKYLGIPNCCRVVFGGKPEAPEYLKRFLEKYGDEEVNIAI